MVAELRRMEDDAHGDDEEAMREMEEEMGGGTQTKKVRVEMDNDPDTGLPPPPPGAWADDALEEEPPSGTEVATAAPKWKKKGLKRQHRRVISMFS